MALAPPPDNGGTRILAVAASGIESSVQSVYCRLGLKQPHHFRFMRTSQTYLSDGGSASLDDVGHATTAPHRSTSVSRVVASGCNRELYARTW